MLRNFIVIVSICLLSSCERNLDQEIIKAKEIYNVLQKNNKYLVFKDISIMPRNENSNLYNIYFHENEVDVWANYNPNDTSSIKLKSVYDFKISEDILISNQQEFVPHCRRMWRFR